MRCNHTDASYPCGNCREARRLAFEVAALQLGFPPELAYHQAFVAAALAPWEPAHD